MNIHLARIQFFLQAYLEESDDLPTPVAVPLGIEAQVLVVDVHDDILSKCREYDPVSDSLATILGFSNDHPSSLPDVSVLLAQVSEWLLFRDLMIGRVFTPLKKTRKQTLQKLLLRPRKPTAKKVSNAMIADQLTAVVAQLQLITQRQDRMEQMASSFAADAPGQYVGPASKLPAVSTGLAESQWRITDHWSKSTEPNRTSSQDEKCGRAPMCSRCRRRRAVRCLAAPRRFRWNVLAALTNQSTALTALVAHLTAQSGDVLGDLATPGQVGSSTKGVQRREKMQNDLACGNSQYFLQMMQQLHRRLQSLQALSLRQRKIWNPCRCCNT